MIDIPPLSALVANTPRLRVVPLRPEDAEEMFPVLNDQRLYRFLGGLPPGEHELAERYRHWQARRSSDGDEVWVDWVVRLVPLGEAIGHVQATVTDDGTAVVEFIIGRLWQGHGFAREATHAVIRMLEAHLGVVAVEAHVHPDDIAGRRTATRLGMRRVRRRSGRGESVYVLRCPTEALPTRRRRRSRGGRRRPPVPQPVA